MIRKNFTPIKNNIVFFKLFLGIVVVSSIAAIILSLSTFYWFREKSVQDVNKSNIMALSNINSLMSNYLESSKKIAQDLYQSNEIKQLIYSNSSEYNDNMKSVYARASSTMTVYSFISSLYIFGQNDILLKSSTLSVPEEYDRFYSTILRKSISYMPTSWILETKLGLKKPLISYVYTTDEQNENSFGNAVMVNINMEQVHDYIFSSPLTSSQEIFIMDKTGKIYMHNNMDFFSSNFSDKSYVKKILESDASSGNFTTTIESSSYSVSYSISKNGDFYAVQLVPYSYTIQKLTDAKNFILTLCAIILFSIIISSLLISLWIYKPINVIFKNIRSMFISVAQNEPNLSEIQLFSNTTSKIIEKVNNYEKEMENKAARDLFSISKNQISTDDLHDILKKMKILTDEFFNYRIVVLRICNFKEYNEKNTLQAMDLQTYSFINIVSEYLATLFECKSYPINNEHAVFVVKGDTTGTEYSELKKLLEKASESVFHYLSLEVCTGVSSITSDIGNIKDNYKDAYELTNYRLVFGKRSVIDTSMIKIEEANHDFSMHYEALTEAVKNNSQQKFEDVFLNLYSICSSYKYDTIVKIFSQAAQSIYRIPANIGYKKHQDEMNFSELTSQIEKIEDFNELKNLFIGLFTETSQIISDLSNSSIRDVTAKALQYLASNYHDQNITANLIAEKLTITPSYFSKIFKICTGLSFSDYLNNLRLEKAKILLTQALDLDISEICTKVGYSNASYFTAAFRKKYGITPSKYRINQLSINK